MPCCASSKASRPLRRTVTAAWLASRPHAAAPRTGPRQRPRQSAQRTSCGPDRQRGRRPRHLSPAVRRAAHLGHRGFARPVSSWIHELKSARAVAADTARAVQAARAAPGGIATLILPADTAWNDATHAARPCRVLDPRRCRGCDTKPSRNSCERQEDAAIRCAAAHWWRGPGGRRPHRAKTGARLFAIPSHRTRNSVQDACPSNECRISPSRSSTRLAGTASRSSSSARSRPSRSSPIQANAAGARRTAAESRISLTRTRTESRRWKRSPCRRWPREDATRVILQLPDLPKGPLNSLAVAQVIAQLTPEHAIFADESNTSGFPLSMTMARARPHDHFALTGGSIGHGLPLAVGAAIAAPIARLSARTATAAPRTPCRPCGPWPAKSSTSPS